MNKFPDYIRENFLKGITHQIYTADEIKYLFKTAYIAASKQVQKDLERRHSHGEKSAYA